MGGSAGKARTMRAAVLLVLSAVLLGAVVVVVLPRIVGVAALLATPDAALRGPDVDDPRACARTKVELDDVAEHFELRLPTSASGVRFYADVHPLFGEYTLELRFSLSSRLLDQFVKDSGFPSLRRQHAAFAGSRECPGLFRPRRHPIGAGHATPAGTIEVVVLREADGRVDVAVRGHDL